MSASGLRQPSEIAQGDVAALRADFASLLQRRHGLDLREAAALAAAADFQAFEEEAPLVREGEAAAHLFWLVRGRLTIHRHTLGEGPILIRERQPGEVIGEISFLLDDPEARYSATVLAHEGSTCARLPFAILRGEAALQPIRAKLYASFARTAAERLSSTTGLAAEAMSLALSRERRLAFHLGMALMVMAGFVVLSNARLELMHELFAGRLSQAEFTNLFYVLFDACLGLLFVFLVRALDLPAETLGLQWVGWRRQIASGLLWSLPALAGAAAVRAYVHPDEPVFSLYARQDGAPPWSPVAILSLVAYVALFCPIQEFIARAGIQAPILDAFRRHAPLGAVVSTLVAAVTFGALHIAYGVGPVLLTGAIGLYWGVAFLYTRSVLAITVSHMILGVAAFYGFGLIR